MTRKTRNSRSNGPLEPDGQTTILCKLFSDHVSEHLCRLRRKELDHKGGFFCEGCPADAVIHGRQKPDTAHPVVPVYRARDRTATERRDNG